MSMIEKVAEAICNDGLSVDLWADSDESARNGWRYAARAAIAAMREPTKEMLKAGSVGAKDSWPFAVEDTWSFMIDAALAEKEG